MSKLNVAFFVFSILFWLSLPEVVFSQKSSSSGVVQLPSIESGHKEGVLHRIFESDGKIFYRRSVNYGSTWDGVRKISDTIEVNERPSISVDVLRIVWQQKIDNNSYSLWYVFSNDGGSTWSNPQIVQGCSKVVVGDLQSDNYSGPTPVVSSFVEFYSENISNFILVYAAYDGLHYRLCYQNRNNWIMPYRSDIVPGTLNNSSVCFPSLATYDGRQYQVSLTYFDGAENVYSQIYTAYLTWSALDTVNLSSTIANNLSSIESVSNKINNYDLSQNFPNPFNPVTKIQFSLPHNSYVTLEVFNTLGERVGVLASEELSAGTYNYSWDASNLTSGVYFYQLKAGSFVETKKMMLTK
jgi:hypothetical protein